MSDAHEDLPASIAADDDRVFISEPRGEPKQLRYLVVSVKPRSLRLFRTGLNQSRKATIMTSLVIERVALAKRSLLLACLTLCSCIAFAGATDGYVKCSDESGVCSSQTPSMVIYGGSTEKFTAPTTFPAGNVACGNATFGDPFYGVVKSCWMKPAPPPPHAGIAVDDAKITMPQPGFSDFRVTPTTEVAPVGDGAFRTSCTLSHMSYDDPLVFPGEPGRSHLHTFFGNSLAGAATTAESLRTTGTSTCRGGLANRSAYWVPTMIDTRTGTPLVPDSVGVYYKNGMFDGSLIAPLPVGLRMIAGNPKRTGPDSPTFSSRFKCIGGPNNENDKYGPSIPNCDVGAQVWSEVFFPQCWDGMNLDSPDHKSHMSYVVQDMHPPFTWSCPATHPVILPQITFNVIYTITEQDAPLHWRLSSDTYDATLPGGYSSHGDWFNGWQKDVSDAFVKNCIQAKRDCHSHLLGDGRMIY